MFFHMKRGEDLDQQKSDTQCLVSDDKHLLK